MKEKKYIIGEEELLELLESSLTLNALDNGGVDNWEWYGEAINSFLEQYNEINNTDYEEIEEIPKEMIECYEELEKGEN